MVHEEVDRMKMSKTDYRFEAKNNSIFIEEIPLFVDYSNRPFSHCLCACVYRSRGALFLDNRRDFTEMGQTDFKPLILSM